MEDLMNQVTQAVNTLNLTALKGIFGPTGSWHSLGQGQQRSLSAHFLVLAMSHSEFTNKMEITEQLLDDVYLECLKTLPVLVEHGADNTLRNLLFDYYSHHGQYRAAAQILATTRIQDDCVYQMTAVQKTQVFVKIAECFLVEDEIAESDAAVNKAGIFVNQIPNRDDHPLLILRYKSTYARVLDKNRKFLSAAARYHDLSLTERAAIDPDELLQFLGRAATCAILAPAGPQKQRILHKIASDSRLDRLKGLPEFGTHPTILQKLSRTHIVKADELQQFKQGLQEHQTAVMGDGLTILERGIVEHNMIAVHKFYQSIYFTELSTILGVDADQAERIAAAMIQDGSLPHGCIDQVDGLLEFGLDDDNKNDDTGGAFDRGVTEFCVQLNALAGSIAAPSN